MAEVVFSDEGTQRALCQTKKVPQNGKQIDNGPAIMSLDCPKQMQKLNTNLRRTKTSWAGQNGRTFSSQPQWHLIMFAVSVFDAYVCFLFRCDFMC